MIHQFESSVKKKRIEALMSALSRVLKKVREERGLSQMEIARRSGMHRTYIHDLERGARNPSLSIVYLLAMALEVPIADLIARAERCAQRIAQAASGEDECAQPAQQ